MTDFKEKSMTIDSLFAQYTEKDTVELLAQIGLVYIAHIHFEQSAESASYELELLTSRYDHATQELLTPKRIFENKTPLNVLREIVETEINVHDLKMKLLVQFGMRLGDNEKKGRPVTPVEKKVKPKTEVKRVEMAESKSFPDLFRKRMLEKGSSIPLILFDLPNMHEWCSEAQQLMLKIHEQFLAVSLALGIEGQLPSFINDMYQELADRTQRLNAEHFMNPKAATALKMRLEMFLTKALTPRNVLLSIKGQGVFHKKYVFYYNQLIRQYNVVLSEGSILY